MITFLLEHQPVFNEHTCTGPWHLCFPRGPRVGPLKTPPPLNIKMSFMNCFKLLSITRNKTCYKDKWVTLKTLPVAYRHIMTHYHRYRESILLYVYAHYSMTLTSQEHYDDRSCARPLLSLAKSSGVGTPPQSFTLFRSLTSTPFLL